jgi:putative membrane-bound dehydrogenase-like protein
MTVPEPFTVTLFAGEPDVMQPIAFCLDDRGRLWVAEAYSYPVRRPDNQAKDRILIFEDTDGDGKFDKRTVFMEGLNLISGLEVGFGGVWIGAAPYLMFVPVRPGEDKPAGPPQILLDGWHYEDTHETLNSFTWGPDGWLYGCHGVFTYSRVGKPGTPDGQRTPINAGAWRYHPTRQVFEVFAQGTSNPWGLDFDDYGQAFIEACVVPHLFHLVPGGRYLRQAGEHFNPYTYADIPTIADHLHWQGANQWAGNNRSDAMGGGHAHCGLMCYLGGLWPEKYRGQLFMGNIHGRRLNMDVLKPQGSGYVASHGPDFLLANDAYARFINVKYGPDGNAYLIDWYDKQACHHKDPNVWDRETGRIYKISLRGSKPVTGIDLATKTDAELVELQLHPNEWYVRHARRILQERAAAGKLFTVTRDSLAKIAFEHPDEARRLRGLWALHAIGGLEVGDKLRGLDDRGEHVRAWTVQLALERLTADGFVLDRMAEMAKKDTPVVRLALAAGLQRLSPNPYQKYWDILEALLSHAEDAADQNMPLMDWYAAEPLAAVDARRALSLGLRSRVPLVRDFMARRVGAFGTPEAFALLVGAVHTTPDAEQHLALLHGLRDALKGRRRAPAPAGWAETYEVLLQSPSADVRRAATALAVTFGNARATADLRRVLADAAAAPGARLAALQSLVDAKDPDLVPILQKLTADPALRGPAIRGLATYDDPKTPAVVLAAYPKLSLEEKRDALNTLASRSAYGKALLNAIAEKTVPSPKVPAEIIRQLSNLKDPEIDRQIGLVWGIVRTTPADRLRLIADYRKRLSAPAGEPDLTLGRAVFAKTCQQCHTLYGTGGKVGPDITGSNRANLDYLLENILDPSAVIPKEYAATTIELKNGRVITGIVRGETPAALTVLTANETLTVPVAEIDTRTPSATSMMPDDLLKPHTDPEVRALFAYLRNPGQVPILATAENAKDFFNGKDLTNWDGDPKLWSVQDGEIVGKSPGIPRNEFLRSHFLAGDFRLSLKLKLVPNAGNSGVQFRSEPQPDGEMRGPQADVGAGWWGKLYDESGRGVVSTKSGEPFVKPNEWNEYVIEAQGSHVRTWINGQPCVDLDDPKLSQRGIFALQIHSGGPMEVRFKDLKLEIPTGGKR